MNIEKGLEFLDSPELRKEHRNKQVKTDHQNKKIYALLEEADNAEDRSDAMDLALHAKVLYNKRDKFDLHVLSRITNVLGRYYRINE